MSVFGNNVPQINLIHLDANNAMTVVSSIILPRPQSRTHDYKEEIKVIKNYEGAILRQDVKYRFQTTLRFVNLSAADFASLATIASWNEVIHFYPSSDVSYYMEPVKVTGFHPFHVNNLVHYDGVEISFQGTIPKPKIVTPDNLTLGKLRTSIQIIEE